MAKITTTLFGELAILPHPAEAPITETLEFLTDVMEAYNGNEERLQLRSKPRHSFKYTVPVQAWNMAAAFNTEAGAIRKRWAVPIWTEAQYVGSVAAAAASIACDTTIYDLRANSLALLFAGCESWQVVEIASITSDSIVPANEVSATSGAWLVPVRLGWIVGNVDKPTSGHNAKSNVTFQLEDSLSFVPPAPSQYLSQDIYYEPGLLAGDKISRTIEQRLDVIDYSLGPVARRSPWDYSRFGTPYRSMIEGPEEMRDFKEFLYRRAGKHRGFYMPTFENNLRLLNTGTIVSTLVVKSDSFIDYANLRTNIAIQRANGSWLARGISNPVQIDPERIQLTLSSPLNIAADSVTRISYLGFNRLDTDLIEISWRGNNVAESEFRILELTQ